MKTNAIRPESKSTYSIHRSSDGLELIHSIELDEQEIESLSSDTTEGHFQANLATGLESLGESIVYANVKTNDQYTTEEIALEARLSASANEEGTIQADKMLAIAPHHRPELHTTMSVARAFEALTGKAYDTDFFCD